MENQSHTGPDQSRQISINWNQTNLTVQDQNVSIRIIHKLLKPYGIKQTQAGPIRINWYNKSRPGKSCKLPQAVNSEFYNVLKIKWFAPKVKERHVYKMMVWLEGILKSLLPIFNLQPLNLNFES